MSKKKNKTYTFSLTSKQDKIVNILASYQSLDGSVRNRSAVVQSAIELYAEQVLPSEWKKMIEALSDEEEEAKE